MKLHYFLYGLLWLFIIPAQAAEGPFYISIIIDDLGYSLENGRRMIELPANLTYSVLPNSPHGKTLARLAHEHQKEVMLHLPMQAETGLSNDPGILTTEMDKTTFKQTLHLNLQSIPFIAGINNHKGSQLTRHFKQMGWLMRELAKTDLYFIDSRTTHQTIAALSAEFYDVPTLDRDVFLDNNQQSEAIDIQLKQLRSITLKKGHAIAIGHPHPATLAALERFLPKLSEDNIILLPASAMIQKIKQAPQQNTSIVSNSIK